MQNQGVPSFGEAFFDEQPIGKGAQLNIDEYPPDFDASELETKKEPIPIGKRLDSKVLKIKKAALEELQQMVSTQKDNEFEQNESKIIKLIVDANAQCQLLACKIILQYVQKKKSRYDGDFKSIIKNVIEKIMTNNKEEMQSVGNELLFFIFDSGKKEMLFDELNQYILNKNPKIMTATLQILRTFLHNYGPKKMDDFKKFEKHFKIQANSARIMGKQVWTELFKELFRWMGEHSFQLNLHHQVKADVIKWAKSYKPQAMKIKRGLVEGEKAAKINPFEEQAQQDFTPVDVLQSYDSRWVDTVLAVEKWKDKKELLCEFIKKTNVPCIVPRDSSQYITLVRRLFSENNINLLQCGFKIVRNLARGLGRHFSMPCKAFLSHIYLKLKDSKAMIVGQTLLTLKAMLKSCITLEQAQEQIKVALKDKSPLMRLNTLKLLKDFIPQSTKQPKTVKTLKSMIDTIVVLNNDGVSEVRAQALQVLCRVKQYHGMLFFEHRLEKLPAKKIAEIKQTAGVVQQAHQKLQESHHNEFEKMEIQEEQPKQEKKFLLKNNKGQKEKPQTNKSKAINNNSNNANKQTGLSTNDSTTARDSSQTVTMQSILSVPSKGNAKLNSPKRSDSEIQNEEWPINPDSSQVIRLIGLLSKMGQPLTILSKPFRLNQADLQRVRSSVLSSSEFVQQHSFILLKWCLWRVLIQDAHTTEKIIGFVIKILQIKSTELSHAQICLVISVMSNCLQHVSCPNISYLSKLNLTVSGMVEQQYRQTVFNFWTDILADSAPEFIDKCMINILVPTYQQLELTSEELINLARIQPIAKNKILRQHLSKRFSPKSLRVYGFNFDIQGANPVDSQKYLLSIEGPEFYVACSPDEKQAYFEAFKKSSGDFFEELQKLQAQCGGNYHHSHQLSKSSTRSQAIIPLHLKIMDTIMLPYFSYSLSLINVYNYFKHVGQTIGLLCQPEEGRGAKIAPYLRSLIRLLTFFLIDLNDSSMDNKDQLMRVVNKSILLLLEHLNADHLLEAMTILLRYSVKNQLNQRLSQLLCKCINKTTKTVSFKIKAPKNVKFLIGYCVSLVNSEKLTPENSIFKSIMSLLTQLMVGWQVESADVISGILEAQKCELEREQGEKGEGAGPSAMVVKSPEILTLFNEFLTKFKLDKEQEQQKQQKQQLQLKSRQNQQQQKNELNPNLKQIMFQHQNTNNSSDSYSHSVTINKSTLPSYPSATTSLSTFTANNNKNTDAQQQRNSKMQAELSRLQQMHLMQSGVAMAKNDLSRIQNMQQICQNLESNKPDINQVIPTGNQLTHQTNSHTQIPQHSSSTSQKENKEINGNTLHKRRPYQTDKPIKESTSTSIHNGIDKPNGDSSILQHHEHVSN